MLNPGDTQHMTFQVGDPQPVFNSRTDKLTGPLDRESYVGKQKGILQILYERGLYKKGMGGSFSELEIQRKIANNKPLPDPTLDAPAALAACQDFINEKSELEETLEECECHHCTFSYAI